MQDFVPVQIRWKTRTALNELKERLAKSGLIDAEINITSDFVVRWMIAQALTRIEAAEREKAHG